MKTIRWIALAIVALGAAGWMLAQAEADKQTEGDSDVRTLRKQVAQSQARLKTLEDRLAKVESAKPGVVPWTHILPKSPSAPPAYQVPVLPGPLGKREPQGKVWGQREVNGWTYYFIPCKAN